MRMSQSGQTAAEFLNHAEEGEIARVLKDYGEEPRARAVARAIVAARPLTRTAELAAVVRKALGYRQGQKSDPATRTFQAIRIHLNAELDELEQGLRAAERSLRPGGRLAVVTFHSLEDRIVKRFLKTRSGDDALRIAPSADGRARARPDLRTSCQAGLAFRGRAGPKPARALGASPYRGPHRCARVGPRHPQEGSTMSARGFGSVLWAGAVAGAALGFYLVSPERRLGARRAGGGRDQDRPGPARHPPAADRDRHARPAGPARAVERQVHPPVGAHRRPVRRGRLPAGDAGRAAEEAGDRRAGGAGLGAGRAADPASRS